MKKIRYAILIMIVFALGFYSCTDQDDVYKQYVVPNGLIYPGQALNPIAKSGNKRIEITWERGVDPKPVKARIFWNNYTDSVDVTFEANTSLISKIISPLNENSYSFMIHTYDAEGNSSIPVEVLGRVYGDVYTNALSNRTLLTEIYDGLDLTLSWHTADLTEIGISVSWTDVHGSNRTMEIDPSETTSVIPEFDYTKPLIYTTMYKPDSLSIDVFNAATVEKIIDPVVQIPKTTWASYLLPGDMGVNGSYPLERFWDGNTTNFMHSDGTTSVPISFTWDMGQKVILDRLRFWPRNNNDDRWSKGMPRFFEIWGSLEPNPDGSFDDTWTLLGSFECVQPSGNGIKVPWEAPTAEDISLSDRGLDFEFIPGPSVDPSATVRYIRFRSLENFNKAETPRLLLAEITFWGTLVR